MKNIFIILVLLLVTFISYSQSVNDSIKKNKQGSFYLSNDNIQKNKQVSNMILDNDCNQNIQIIKMNLAKSHKRYKTGLYTSLVGSSLSVLGSLLNANNNKNKSIREQNQFYGEILTMAGGITFIIGGIIIIDSHKFIGRAGNGVISVTFLL